MILAPVIGNSELEGDPWGTAWLRGWGHGAFHHSGASLNLITVGSDRKLFSAAICSLAVSGLMLPVLVPFPPGV